MHLFPLPSLFLLLTTTTQAFLLIPGSRPSPSAAAACSSRCRGFILPHQRSLQQQHQHQQQHPHHRRLLASYVKDTDADVKPDESDPRPEEEEEEGEEDEEEDEEEIIMRFFQEIAQDEAEESAEEKSTRKKAAKQKKKQKQEAGPQPCYQDLALMAEAARDMPVDFLLQPDLAYYQLGGEMQTCRFITGTWQLDGKHGYHPFFLDAKQAIQTMVRFDGYTTFDVAPFYGQVERWLGDVRLKIEDPLELDAYKIFTKLVFPPMQEEFTKKHVEDAVDASLARLRASRLDLVQLHWWDFEDPRYLDVLNYMHELKEKGKIRHVGVTNFDGPALEKAIESGLPIVSNQVQYSLLDQRARRGSGNLTDICLKHNVTLLTYGSLLGGFLTDRWLGEAAPDPRAFSSTSEDKYWEILRTWGSWEEFQELLSELKAVARKHRSTIAHVALRWVLDQPAVGSVVVGTRLGYVDHLEENKQVLKLRLTAQDRENIARAAGLGKDMSETLEGVGMEYTYAWKDCAERYWKD